MSPRPPSLESPESPPDAHRVVEMVSGPVGAAQGIEIHVQESILPWRFEAIGLPSARFIRLPKILLSQWDIPSRTTPRQTMNRSTQTLRPIYKDRVTQTNDNDWEASRRSTATQTELTSATEGFSSPESSHYTPPGTRPALGRGLSELTSKYRKTKPRQPIAALLDQETPTADVLEPRPRDHFQSSTQLRLEGSQRTGAQVVITTLYKNSTFHRVAREETYSHKPTQSCQSTHVQTACKREKINL